MSNPPAAQGQLPGGNRARAHNPGTPAAEPLTFLFTDLEGSTRLWEQHPEAMQEALRRHDAILRTAIESSGGQVVKTTGDGMMAVFERATAAITASITAQRQLAAEPWAGTGPLRSRMGIHAGGAQERGGDYFGPTVNRTARIMAAGHGGQVLVSMSAAGLAEAALPPQASLLDLGEHRLKDLGSPERILQVLHPDLAREFPPLAGVRPGSASLPARSGQLIGRESELARILELLADPDDRLLTLTGIGGTGKTSLAIRAAAEISDHFAGNVTFVDLASVRETPGVLVAIARCVGLGDVMDRPLADELARWLRDRRMLLVLDNLEQVARAASVVADLLRDCPELSILATSREALHVRAEHVLAIAPLAVPPPGGRRTTAAQIAGFAAVRLFVDRARGVRPEFELTDANAAAVAEICRRLDGLPLAIELAAVRLRLFSPEALRDRLDDRLGLLRSGLRDLPERQQTLRAAMDWSYELLEPDERRLFEFMSVFAGAEIGAIETVAADVEPLRDLELDLLDGLAGLIEKSLLRQVDASGEQPRVSMLETVREFAGDKLDEQPALAEAARHAHADFYAELAGRLRPNLMGREREAALTAMVADLPNLRIAWRHWASAGDLGQLDKLADALLIVNDARGWYQDSVDLTTDMLAVLERSAGPDARSGQEIALRITLARALMATRGFTQEAEDALTGALELFERGGDVRQQFSVLRGLASLYQFQAQFGPASRLGAEILALGEREHNAQIQVDGHLLMGVNLAFGSDLRGGLDHLDAAIALFETGPSRGATHRVANDPRVACLTTSGFTLWMMGFPDRALERMNAALRLAEQLGHPITSAYAAYHAGLLHLWRREPDMADRHAAQVLDVADEYELGIWAAVGRCLHGAAEVGLGAFGQGMADIRAGLEQYRGRRSPPVFWPLLLFLEAGASLVAGRPADGLASLEPAIEMMSGGTGTALLPEFHLLKGDLLASERKRESATGDGAGDVALDGAPGHDDPGHPEHWYRLAHDGAVRLGARQSQLRAAVRLAWILAARGHGAEGVELLTSIRGTFTEGFATADVLEADQALAELAAQT